ncbi:MAG: zinc ribbon domain-containing protein [Chloroflexi bacterium]|uniref:Zinc ribbon domain-containing protein n=1 Tax=Candidatus Chlorohelix allophototropha TaxID=3003348 RepID=A0A8T7M4I7_9CHLR|nr:zinc ribbon domain-containing protein [Chloroflexota bacterium]WJW70011.1 zinc ribbon domain-containing protein [Chloroflexota bacterium L227-S17]
MPMYDYACNNCGHRFEKSQSMSESPLKVCPECSTEALRKVFSPTGLVFKGAGWYKNDSRSVNASSESSCATGTCPMANFGG